MTPIYSLVIPVYNEETSLPILWNEIVVIMKKINKPFEAIFVNDGSNDSSLSELEKLQDTYPDLIKIFSFRRNFGKASALRKGFEMVSGNFVITLDSDLQDDPAEFPNLIAKMDEGYDLVTGYKKTRHDPFHKTIPSRFFNGMIRRVSGLNIHDINCGLKIYRREVTDSLHIYGELYRFIPVLAANEGFKVAEIETNHRPRKYGVSKYGFSRFMRGFLDLLTVTFLTKFIKRPLHLFGSIGVVIAGIGILISLYMTILHFFFHQIVGERPLLAFGILFIISGIQLISTGLLAELITYHIQEKAARDNVKSNSK